MKAYEWILFDADDTLFHFDAQAGLTRMFAGFGVDFGDDDYREYNEANRALWLEYQDGTITAAQLQARRFDAWAARLGVAPQRLNGAFLEAMAELCTPLAGAVELLQALRGRARLGIITNGFTELQQARLRRTGLHGHFEFVAISEQVGAAKPQPAIFAHALAQMGAPARECVLMVGDNPDTDIRGGLAAGLQTCWFNPHSRAAPEGVVPHHQVASLPELRERLLRAYAA